MSEGRAMADGDSKTSEEPAEEFEADAAWGDIVVRLRGYLRSRVQPRFVDDLLGSIMLRLIEHEG